MNRVRLLLERVRRVRRPPTGPLTTAEATAAELRQETQAKGDETFEPTPAPRPPAGSGEREA